MYLIEGVEKLWDEGFVVVTAAGNQGPAPGSITAPGCSRKVITVGSSDLLEGKGAVSGRGPTFQCVCKPDLVVPGNRIVSCAVGKPDGYGIKKRHVHVHSGGIRSSCLYVGKRPVSHKCGNQNDAERKL